jgi:hypothetical protein
MEPNCSRPKRRVYMRPPVDPNGTVGEEIEEWAATFIQAVLGDSEHRVQPSDLLDTGATEQDDFDPAIREWLDVTSESEWP